MGKQPKDTGKTPVKQSFNTFQQLNKTYRDKGLSLKSFEQTDQQSLQDWRDCQPVTCAIQVLARVALKQHAPLARLSVEKTR